MARAVARATRRIPASRWGAVATKRRASSAGTKSRKPGRGTKVGGKATKPAPKKSGKASTNRWTASPRKARAASSTKRTGSLKLTARKKKAAGRTKKVGRSSAPAREKNVQIRKKQVVSRRGGPYKGLTRMSKKVTGRRRLPRRRRAGPRLVRCGICGNLVPWVSVDNRCFPCLKKGLALRRREEETRVGAYEADEGLVSTVR